LIRKITNLHGYWLIIIPAAEKFVKQVSGWQAEMQAVLEAKISTGMKDVCAIRKIQAQV
jgi:hypothetical protein